MQTCYNHPKLQAVAHCRRCKLPTCCHCVEDLYCPDCIKLQRYLALGRTSDRKPQLIETPKRRSVTMELMIQRLQRQAFDADAASLNPPRRSTPRRSKPAVKSRQGLSYGLLMPGIAPLVKVSRSPISRFAALALVAFSLGAFFSQTRTTYAEPAPPAAQEVAYEDAAVEQAPAPVEVRTHYKPVYIYVNTPQAAPPAYRIPTPAPTVVPRTMIGYAPAIAHAPAPAKPAAAPAAAPAGGPPEAEPELDQAIASMRGGDAPSQSGAMILEEAAPESGN